MAIFIDVFYPENSKISNRLSELVSDCQTLFADASVHKEEIETKLETCNKIIKEAYEKLSKTPPPLVSMEESIQWPVYVSEVLLDIFASTSAVSAIRWAIANNLVKTGKISAERLAELGINSALKVTLPKWLNVSRVVAESGVAIAIMVAINMIVDAANGAIERDKLKKAVREAAITRLDAKVVDMFNRNLLKTLDAVIVSYNVFSSMSLPPEVFDKMIQELVLQNKISEDSISRDVAIDWLIDFDETRKSWINEDGNWKEKKVKRSLYSLRMKNIERDRIQAAINQVDDLSDEIKAEFMSKVRGLCVEEKV